MGTDAMDGGRGCDAVLGSNEADPQSGDGALAGGWGGDFVDAVSAGADNDAVEAANIPAACDVIDCGGGFDRVLAYMKAFSRAIVRGGSPPSGSSLTLSLPITQSLCTSGTAPKNHTAARQQSPRLSGRGDLLTSRSKARILTTEPFYLSEIQKSGLYVNVTNVPRTARERWSR